MSVLDPPGRWLPAACFAPTPTARATRPAEARGCGLEVRRRLQPGTPQFVSQTTSSSSIIDVFTFELSKRTWRIRTRTAAVLRNADEDLAVLVAGPAWPSCPLLLLVLPADHGPGRLPALSILSSWSPPASSASGHRRRGRRQAGRAEPPWLGREGDRRAVAPAVGGVEASDDAYGAGGEILHEGLGAVRRGHSSWPPRTAPRRWRLCGPRRQTDAYAHGIVGYTGDAALVEAAGLAAIRRRLHQPDQPPWPESISGAERRFCSSAQRGLVRGSATGPSRYNERLQRLERRTDGRDHGSRHRQVSGTVVPASSSTIISRRSVGPELAHRPDPSARMERWSAQGPGGEVVQDGCRSPMMKAWIRSAPIRRCCWAWKKPVAEFMAGGPPGRCSAIRGVELLRPGVEGKGSRLRRTLRTLVEIDRWVSGTSTSSCPGAREVELLEDSVWGAEQVISRPRLVLCAWVRRARRRSGLPLPRRGRSGRRRLSGQGRASAYVRDLSPVR